MNRYESWIFFLITVLQNVKLYREQQQTGANLFWQCKQCLSVLKEQNTAMCHCCFGVLILFFFFSEILCPEDTKNIILVVLWNFHSQKSFYKWYFVYKNFSKQVIIVFKISVSCLGNLEPNALAFKLLRSWYFERFYRPLL